jgi:coenzyme F420 hydrogenase subunit delta
MPRNLWGKDIVILGCGNLLLGDDGFGPAVIKHLKEHYQLPEAVLALEVGTGLRNLLFDLLLSEEKPDKLIIVDAVDYPGHRPGEVFEIPVDEIPARKTGDFSLHQFPPVNMLQELERQTGVEVVVMVVQIGTLPEEVKAGLSPEVAAALDPACQRLLAHVGANPGRDDSQQSGKRL